MGKKKIMHESAEIREAIERFKVWSEGKIRYTGRQTNANKMLKILPVFVAFIKDTAEFWEEVFGYRMKPGRNPGQLATIYPIFRDDVRLQALNEMRTMHAQKAGESADILPPAKFDFKNTPRMNGKATPRAVVGWVVY